MLECCHRKLTGACFIEMYFVLTFSDFQHLD